MTLTLHASYSSTCQFYLGIRMSTCCKVHAAVVRIIADISSKSDLPQSVVRFIFRATSRAGNDYQVEYVLFAKAHETTGKVRVLP